MRSPTGSSQLVTGSVVAPGDVLGRYRILAPQGSSTTDIDPRGFTIEAALYRAEEGASRLPVLLKVFKRPYSASDPFVKGLIAEGKRVASFMHPNVVSVYDAGFERGRLYVAMQQVDGDTLLDRRRAGGLSAAGTIALLAPLAEALDAAHAAGLVHGEITPATIRVDAGGVPHLDAFGVARRVPDGGIAGVRLADIGYASPELRGGRRLTGASDVYALTAVLAHCLTGEAPFPKDSGAVGERLASRLGRRRGGRSRGPADALDAVIACGMASDPARRYAHAQALIGAAASALAAPASPAPPLRAPALRAPALRARGTKQPAEPASRRRVVALLVCGCLALGAVALSALGGSGGSASTAPNTAGARSFSTTPLTVRYEQPPGPDTQLTAALAQILAPLGAAQADLRGLRAGSLPARAAAARRLARRTVDAAQLVSELTAPATDVEALSALDGALRAAAIGFADLGAAAAADDRRAYLGARARVLAAGKLLRASSELLVGLGVRPPALRVLYLVPLPPSPARSTQARSAQAQPPSAGPAGAATTTAPSLPAAPVSTPAVPPATPASSPAPVIPSPPPASTPSSEPPPPTVVVVPTGSGPTSTEPAQTSTVVVVPTG
ncbi:MAG: serine/threonine protein kinase [Solirubrobacteraceae bacterium]